MRVPGLAGQLAPARRDDARVIFDFVVHPEGTRIHQDRAQFVIEPAGATQQQQTGTRQLAEAMNEILRVTEESALGGQLIQDANVDLASLAKSLQAVVSRFELKGADTSR